MKIIKFGPDTKHRKEWFTGISFSHPAKMVLPLQLWIIDNFTKEGETILDPMAGSGTVLVACSMGRHVITVELEDKFVQMQKDNWEKIKQRGPQLGYQMGTATILKGDARNLKDVLISTLLHGSINSVITSPPYEGMLSGTGGGILNREIKKKFPQPYSAKGNTCQIGHLRGESYLSAMLLVYQNCFAVLKEGGLMVVVTKNFIRDKKQVRLDLDTIKLCEQAGFTFEDRWYRELTQQSFWRIIYHQKYPDVEPIRYEDVLIFRKQQDGGDN